MVARRVMGLKWRHYSVLMLVLMCWSMVSPVGHAAERLQIYTSVKESLMGKLRHAFMELHPGIIIDYHSSGAGLLMERVAAEHKNGKIQADILWTMEVPHFYELQQAGLLEPYISPLLADALNPFEDFDGSFTAVRLGILGIAYNTRRVSTPPTTWADLTTPAFNNGFVFADPSASGSMFMGIVLLQHKYGWRFFQDLHKNGARVGKGAIHIVASTAAGDALACLGVDYIVHDAIGKGAGLGMVIPDDMIVIPSPVAIIKGTKHKAAAQKFIDFMLSYDAQSILASEGTVPVRTDVPLAPCLGSLTPQKALLHAMKAPYVTDMAEKDDIIQTFRSIMGMAP